MSVELNEVLKKKAVNDWTLFWLITGPISIVMVIAMMRTELSSGEAVSSMIQLSVRCAVPLLYLAFAASSIQVLFPGPLSRWLLRNRKIIGLCFAAAMAWQLLFILWLVSLYSDYYMKEVYVLRDVIEGVLGYLFLIAMVLTSFRFGRKHLDLRQWKLLHKSGIYFLWAYAFSVYWWNLFFYREPVWLDYVYYWSGFLACGLRAAAWRKKRWQVAQKGVPQTTTHPVFMMSGLVLVALGLIAAATDAVWRAPAEALLTGHAITRLPELYLPYYPPTPYMSLFIIALGAFLTTKPTAYRQRSQPRLS
jgi:hypothetical protein